MSKKGLPISDLTRQTIRIIAYTLFFALIGICLFIGCFTITLNNRPVEPKLPPPEPLIIELKVGESASYRLGETLERAAAFSLPLNTTTPFSYAVFAQPNIVSQYTLTNVTIGCDYVSNDLMFLDNQKQPITVPFEISIGTLKQSKTVEYSGFLETSIEKPDMYKMDWHVTSDQTEYAFVIYIAPVS